MAILGAAISAAGGLVGSILGGIASRKARKRQEQILRDRERQATNLYNRDFYKDYTQTASAQSALRKAREVYDNYTNKLKATQAVTGGTQESVAAAKAAANKSIADATANIAAAGENSAQRAQDRYNAQKDSIDNARANIEADKARQSAAAGAQALNIGAKLAGALYDNGASKTPQTAADETDEEVTAQTEFPPVYSDIDETEDNMFGLSNRKKYRPYER